MGGRFNFSFEPICASNLKWEVIVSSLIPKSDRTEYGLADMEDAEIERSVGRETSRGINACPTMRKT